MTDAEIEELKGLAAKMYSIIQEGEGFDRCTEPTGLDEACIDDCSSCPWYRNDMLDDLLRLGVQV